MANPEVAVRIDSERQDEDTSTRVIAFNQSDQRKSDGQPKPSCEIVEAHSPSVFEPEVKMQIEDPISKKSLARMSCLVEINDIVDLDEDGPQVFSDSIARGQPANDALQSSSNPSEAYKWERPDHNETNPQPSWNPPINKVIARMKHNDKALRGVNRTTSIIKPKTERSAIKSFRYSTETVIWLFYHSSVLSIIPGLVFAISLGVTRAFRINYENMLVHFTITTGFLLLSMYMTIVVMTSYVFGPKISKSIIYTITVPFCIADITTFVIREVYLMPNLGYLNYIIFFFHFFFSIKTISRRGNSQRNENQLERTRYDILSSDGTPMVMFKGYVSYILSYYIVSSYVLPYVMESKNILIKICGRVLVAPLLFNFADSYMNKSIMYMSKEHVKYRMVEGNILSNASSCILRLMVTGSGSLKNTALMSLSSAIIDVGMRASNIPRTLYTTKLIQIAKESIPFPSFLNNKIQNLDSVSPANNQEQGPSVTEENHAPRPRMDKIDISLNGIRNLFTQLNEGDNMTHYILTYRENRSYFLSMGEIQLTIALPLILWLYHPIQEYVTFHTFTTLNQALLSITIQLPITLLSQFGHLFLENYLFGIDVSISKSWTYNLKPGILVHCAFATLMSLHLAISPFRLETVDWPKD